MKLALVPAVGNLASNVKQATGAECTLLVAQQAVTFAMNFEVNSRHDASSEIGHVKS